MSIDKLLACMRKHQLMTFEHYRLKRSLKDV